jgi:ribonuclease HI
MLGAMYAVRTAIKNGYKAVEICYDYQGIEAWVTGAWRSKNELTQKYSAFMRKWGQDIKIIFTKVAAHTNIKYNELADKTAKRGLTEGNGVPEIKLFENMTLYNEE